MAGTQSKRHAAVGTPLGDDVLLLRRFSGTETLGAMFSFDLDMLSEERDIVFEKLVGQNVTVRLDLTGGTTRYFNGYVSRLVQTGAGSRHVSYRATVVPWLWFLTRVADCRIFQDKTVPDIIKDVFRARGFSDFDDSGLSGTYRTWEYCVQYRETDFNFISRLMEHEGIYYYFKHEDAKHTLMLVDSPSAHPILTGHKTIGFRPPSKAVFTDETISEWTVEKQIQPGVVALTDFDFINPKNALEAKAAISRDHIVPDLEVFDYPGDYAVVGDGETYARVRIEELQTQYEVATGVTDVRALAPGYRFSLVDHPREDQNREYLVTSATYEIESDTYEATGGGGGGGGGGNGNGKPTPPDDTEPYDCTFTAMSATEPFRAPRTARKPSIAGPQTAIVVGKSGEEIWTDEHGRVKVQFHWDRYSKADETSSCWIRVSQNWAGKKWGAFALPRIGQEVIVEFLEGDPDRPIITGRVYNGDNKAPYDLPANATMTTLKSSTSKGGAGFNEIRFEDKQDKEQIFIHAERRFDLRVKASALTSVGGNHHLNVKGDAFEHVEGSRNETIDTDHKEKVTGNRHLSVGGDQITEITGGLSISVTGDAAMLVTGAHGHQVDGDYHLSASGIVIEATSGITLKCGSSAVVIGSSGVTIKGSTITLDGSTVKIASGPGDSPADGAGAEALTIEEPEEAVHATTADPGEISDAPPGRENPRTPPKINPTPVPNGGGGGGGGNNPPPKVPIEFKLVDAADQPVADEDYKIYVSGEPEPRTGKTKSDGTVRLEDLEPGSCQIQFPNRYDAEWFRFDSEDLA